MFERVKKSMARGVYFDCVRTDIFRFASFSLTFPLGKLSFDERCALYLLSRMMESGSFAYPTVESLDVALSMMYDAEISFSFTESEDGVLFHAEADFADAPIVGEDLFLRILSHVRETLTRPFPSGEMLERLICETKSENDGDVRGILSDPDAYAFNAYKDAVYRERYPDRMTLDGMLNISCSVGSDELFAIHERILSAPLSYAFYIGRKDAEAVCEAIAEAFTLGECERVTPMSPKRDETAYVSDRQMGDASRLLLGFSYGCDELSAGMLAQYLGGVPTSRLYKTVREERRLCYSIFAERSNTGLFTVGTTVEARRERAAVDTILEVIEEAVQTTDKAAFDAAKQATLMAAEYVYENRRACERFFFSSFLRGEDESAEERIRRIRSVSESELREAARSLSIETVYLLKGKDESIRKRGYTKGEWIDE